MLSRHLRVLKYPLLSYATHVTRVRVIKIYIYIYFNVYIFFYYGVVEIAMCLDKINAAKRVGECFRAFKDNASTIAIESTGKYGWSTMDFRSSLGTTSFRGLCYYESMLIAHKERSASDEY